jgi:ribosomal protein S18 acetylase RimI-like enzyme
VQWDGPDGSRSYLLLWYGDPSAPVVHWVGQSSGDLELVREIPPTTQVAVVPERVAWAVLKHRHAHQSEPLLTLAWEGARPPRAPAGSSVRRLDGDDHAEVVVFVRRFFDRLTTPYATVDLDRETVWGAFDGDRLAGLARAPVRLPAVWVIGGIFVAPPSRRRGHGRSLTRAAIAAASSTGAKPALYVREPNTGARRLYEELGFRAVDRKVWIDFTRAAATAPVA